MRLDGPKLGAASGSVDSLVVLCHGYGANGADLIGLAPYFQRILPGTAFVAPNAPEPCEMGGNGFQWFPIKRNDPVAAEKAIEKVYLVLEEFIANELAHFGLQDDRLALIGFSQGTMLSLHTGLRRKQAPAAIIGFSGALIGADKLHAIKQRPPILLIHGDADPMISHKATIAAAQALSQTGFACQYHISSGVGHAISPDGLELGVEFLHQHLKT